MAGIRKVVLYKHGVGYFEREEVVEGDAEVRLTFREAEMNDVLKSLTVQDHDGGSVRSISYETQKSVQDLLADSALQLPKAGGLTAILDQLRGAAVRVRVGSKTTEGQVVGLEETRRQTAQGLVISNRLSLLDRSGSLFTFDLAEINEVNFVDETVRKELSFYYDTLMQGFKPGTKSLSVFARGEGQRRLSLGYVVAAPVWKTSYRFALSSQNQVKPFIEGWALIDNPNDEDWEGVELSLVAGLPISFVHDLYSPRYVTRREVRVESQAAAGPVMLEAGFAAGGGGVAPNDPFAASFASADPFAAPPVSFADPFGMPEAAAARPAASRSVVARHQAVAQVQTVTQSVGDLFEYKISHPVTVHRRQSALVPIVAREFSGGRVVLYKRAERPEHPFSAVEFENSTGLTLEGGPVMVFEDEVYAGEAMLDTLKPGERRIIPFAVDLSIRVDAESEEHHRGVHEIRASGDYLEVLSAQIHTHVYLFQSNDDRDKVCWLEQPFEAGELHDSPEPSEKTPHAYRFRFELPARQTTRWNVSFRQERFQLIALQDLKEEQILTYGEWGFFDDSSRASLLELAQLNHQRSEIQSRLRSLNEWNATLHQEQKRLRENLQALGLSSEEARLRSSYIEKLQAQEHQIEENLRLTEQLKRDFADNETEVRARMLQLSFVSRRP